MKNSFKKVGIIFNPDIEGAKLTAETISKKIPKSGIYSLEKVKNDVDLVIIVGGDGTFLKATRLYCKNSTPILGFNMGRLGYLAQAKPDEIDEVIKKLNNFDFNIEKRLMLKASIKKNSIALNDIVIKGKNTARTATLDLYINNKLLCSYVADGIIVSTPTGSTAYSLSAGGPIISPNLDCITIIPICPHTLNTRPIVIPSSEKIRIETREKNQKLNVSFDGQVEIEAKDKIEIEKNENPATLLILNRQKDKFYDILKEKLHWSIPLGK